MNRKAIGYLMVVLLALSGCGVPLDDGGGGEMEEGPNPQATPSSTTESASGFDGTSESDDASGNPAGAGPSTGAVDVETEEEEGEPEGPGVDGTDFEPSDGEREVEDSDDEERDDEERDDEERDDEESITSPVMLRIQAMGDSHLAWNDTRSTANQVSAVLSERGQAHVLENNAVSGATLGCGDAGVGSNENCIPPQYVDGEWTHILLSGGGNDFLNSACRLDVDRLISADLRSGLMADLVQRFTTSGVQVLLVGYVEPLDPNGEAGSCRPIRTLLDRYRALAAGNDGIAFIDTRDVIQPNRRALYDDDVHTSVQGSRVLAEYIADHLRP